MQEKAPMRLSDLTGLIRETLQNRFARESFWVLADVSDHKYYPQKKHHYFDLVEKEELGDKVVARISTSAWQQGASSIEVFERETGQKFTTGIHVLVLVKVEYNPMYGLKLVLVDVDSRFTLGELEKKKQDTIRRLLTECSDYVRLVGDRIVTRNQGHILNLALQKIAVVASTQSAGYQDFVHTLQQNPYGYLFSVDTYHTAVQGEDRAREVYEQLLNVFKSGKSYDLVVIIRGGGAESDFLIFNDYNLNRAIAKFPIPIVTGIGHLKDQSIADLMAHTETKTPTKAAEFIITHNKLFEDRLLQLQKNMLIKAQQIFSNRQRMLTNLNTVVVNKSRDYLQHFALEMQRINRVVTHNSMQIVHGRRNEMVSLSGRVISQPRITVARKSHELEQLVSNINTFRNQFLKNQWGSLEHHALMVKALSPEKTLKRGFAILKKDGHVLSDPSGISMGDELTVVMHRAELTTTVKAIADKNGSADNI